MIRNLSRGPKGMPHRANVRTPRRTARREPMAREPMAIGFETMEARRMLSACPVGYAASTIVRSHAANGAVAMATSGPTGHTPAEIRHAYGFDSVSFSGAVANGAGTTIAIVDAYDNPNIANDLRQFDLRFGLPDPVFTKVNQTGGTTMPAANAGWASEIALDVEWAHAIAPGASILLVEARSNSMSDLMTAVNYARSQPGVVAISMSWGGGEFSGETTYDASFTTPAGHAGVAFFASSGDAGAPTSYPAASPNVVSVGGTSLFTGSAGAYSSESGWSGSGGGISVYEQQPAYQSGVVTQSATRRANPDVAYDSDPATGFAVYDSYTNGTARPWSQFGGTSAAAPQWAALTAIVDQGRGLAGRGSLDGRSQLLPAIYAAKAGDFHDVTSGSSTGSPSYAAAAGYDLVTGRGTPVANLLIADLIAWGTSTTVTTPTAPTPPPTPAAPSIAAPADVTATVLSKTSVQVSWTASAGATGYAVLWSDGTTTTQVASVNARTTSVKFTGLKAGSTNSFAVTASNATSSATSAWVTVTLPAAVSLAAPQNLSFSQSSGSAGTLSWSASAAATGYMVYAADAGGRGLASAWVDAGSTSVSVSGLRAGRSYLLRVVAVNADGSAASDWLSLTVPSGLAAGISGGGSPRASAGCSGVSAAFAAMAGRWAW